MDVWADKRPLKTAAVILLAILLSSCTARQVIVVSDPYIDALNSGSWAPSGTWFSVRARLTGNKISSYVADPENTLLMILESAGPAEIIVLSPWNAASPDRLPAVEGRLIVAGAAPGDNMNPNTSYITPDRSAPISEIARLSAGIASQSGRNALALVNASTPAGVREKQLLTESFQEALPGTENTVDLLILDMADESDGQIPSDFKESAAESSVLLLLAGPFNIIALTESGDSGVPVFTENISVSKAWKDRIIASIEDNPKSMIEVLLAQLNSEVPDEQQYYPARLVKGDLYGSQSR